MREIFRPTRLALGAAALFVISVVSVANADLVAKKDVFVVTEGKQAEFDAMVAARNFPAAQRYTECFIKKGTRLRIVDANFFSNSIFLVVDGPSAGCRGHIYDLDTEEEDTSYRVGETFQCSVTTATLPLRKGDDLAALVRRIGATSPRLTAEFETLAPTCVANSGDQVHVNSVSVDGGFTFWTVVKDRVCNGVVLTLDGTSCGSSPASAPPQTRSASAKRCRVTMPFDVWSKDDATRFFSTLNGATGPLLAPNYIKRFEEATPICSLRPGENVLVQEIPKPVRFFIVGRINDLSCVGVTLRKIGFDCPS